MMETKLGPRVFSAAHRISSDEGKCSNIHGHNYSVTMWFKSEVHAAKDIYVIAWEKVKAHIDFFDHKLILYRKDILIRALEASTVQLAVVPFEPSSENLAQYFASKTLSLFDKGRPIRITVELRETDNILAIATANT